MYLHPKTVMYFFINMQQHVCISTLKFPGEHVQIPTETEPNPTGD